MHGPAPGADYRSGRIDGLREALAVLAAEEAKWAARMERSQRGKTFRAQSVRRQAFKSAQTRIRTALNQLERRYARSGASGIATTLKKLGL